MDADWDQVTVQGAPANHKLYGNPKFGGIQYTVASLSVMGYWGPAEDGWRPDPPGSGQCRRRKMGRRGIRMLDRTEQGGSQVGQEPDLWPNRSFRETAEGNAEGRSGCRQECPAIIACLGKDTGRVDVPSKTDGSAQYGMDVQIDGMVYASIQRSPVSKAKPVSVNDAEIMKIKGVKKVIKLPYGVAVVGDTVEATKSGREALDVKWSKAPGDTFTTETAMGDYPENCGGSGPRSRHLEDQGRCGRRYEGGRNGQDLRIYQRA